METVARNAHRPKEQFWEKVTDVSENGRRWTPGTDAELHELYSSYSNSNWSGTENWKCLASSRPQKRNRWNFCKTIWFAVDNWELKAEWHPHCGIINVHFLHKIFSARAALTGWLQHHIVITQSLKGDLNPHFSLFPPVFYSVFSSFQTKASNLSLWWQNSNGAKKKKRLFTEWVKSLSKTSIQMELISLREETLPSNKTSFINEKSSGNELHSLCVPEWTCSKSQQF